METDRALHAQPAEIQPPEGPVQAPRPNLPARSADESFSQVYSGDDAAGPGQMEGHASSSAGSVQHRISTAEMQRFKDEPGFSLPHTVGVEPEPVLHRFKPVRHSVSSGAGLGDQSRIE